MAADPLDALRLSVVPVDPRPEFTAALLRRINSGATGPAGQPQSGQPGAEGPRGNPTVRYFVGDLDAAIEFYCQRLGFEEELRSAPAFAMLYGGGFRLLLSVPGLPGAGRPLPDGTVPAAGGSNRITLQVPDVTAAIAELRAAGVPIRADVSAGVAVRQALIEDPAGNLVELYEPTAGYHERTSAS
jgi:catechol 2,3-dioxygenase-like lactoylglutathione lyase family enzyme